MVKEFSEEELMLYADGRLDADKIEGVEDYLKNNEEAQDFVAKMKFAKKMVKKHLGTEEVIMDDANPRSDGCGCTRLAKTDVIEVG